MTRGYRIPAPSFPPAPDQYNRENEAAFRASVEQAIQMQPPPLTKSLRLPNTSFVATTNSTTWVMVSGGLTPFGAVGGDFRGSVVLPRGVIVTGLSARLYRVSGSDHASATLQSIDDDGNATTLVTVTSSSTGWTTESDTIDGELVDDESHFVIFVQLDNSTATGDALILWAEIQYLVRSPNVMTV